VPVRSRYNFKESISMAKYKIQLQMTQTFIAEVEIEAESLEAAMRLAEEKGSEMDDDNFEYDECFYTALDGEQAE
jgi:hypothetical protein